MRKTGRRKSGPIRYYESPLVSILPTEGEDQATPALPRRSPKATLVTGGDSRERRRAADQAIFSKHLAIAAFGVAAFTAASTGARAAPAYLGSWKIASAVVAPWADKANLAVNTAEKTRLIGRTVSLAPNSITGPQPFPCKGPHYKLRQFTADMLFEGQLGELQDANPKLSAAALAAKLGFTGKTVTVLDTGCEIDWHFVDAKTVEVGLNDYVYTLKKP
jgi:hypothetical protein